MVDRKVIPMPPSSPSNDQHASNLPLERIRRPSLGKDEPVNASNRVFLRRLSIEEREKLARPFPEMCPNSPTGDHMKQSEGGQSHKSTCRRRVM